MKSKLYSTLILSFLLAACNGQKNTNEASEVTQPEEVIEGTTQNTNASNSPLFTPDNNRISQVVRTIFQDRQGNIWFGGEGGTYKLSNNTLTLVTGVGDPSGTGITVKEITEDSKGRIWIAHTNGVSCLEGDEVTNYNESDGLISDDTWCISADMEDRIWIGTYDGLCVFDGHEFRPFELPEGKLDSSVGVSSTKMIHSIYQDRSGTLWFSSNAGLFSYANNTLIHVSQRQGIETRFVNEIFEDKKGGLWVSTKRGLYKLTNDGALNVTAGKIETGKGIGSIAEDSDGNLWFVSNQHSLYMYNGDVLTEFPKTAENSGPVVFQIFKDRDDRLWFVGFGGAFRLEDGTFIHITKDGPW